ncbi:uncharacterized protein LOC125188936 [Salvia hispanica]|uniref:uncharacterized protein LOC125188936 n=1 Tax=Salvia hispanica TaxID=49212 RepID=UPI002009D3F8|nr:uncharacterized protein LOC125188936 [Salvia hispanica]
MANPVVNGGKVRVEAIQTVVPTKATDPRQSRRITVSQNVGSTALLQRRFHLLLCYNKASSGDSGWLLAGQIKESLGRALKDYPLLAGRLRWCDADLEIVCNDSGTRMVETKAEMALAAFVEKREDETELVFWEDVFHHTPQFSPLFYIQVTNFTCGGYSIGISCSILLGDPFTLTTIIKKWASLHNTMFPSNEIPQIPMFYLPNHGPPPSFTSLLTGSNTTKDPAESLIFNIPTNILNSDNNTHKHLAALCVEEAERETGQKLAPNLSLLVQLPPEDDTVEVCSREGLLECSKLDHGAKGVSFTRAWDELELDNICFNEGNKPIYASCWINSVVDEGCVIIAPSTDQGLQIVVTFT